MSRLLAQRLLLVVCMTGPTPTLLAAAPASAGAAAGLAPIWPARSEAQITPLPALLPGDVAPQPEDALWQPMRLPTFEPSQPSNFTQHDGRLVMYGSFGSVGRTRVLGAASWDGATFERLGTVQRSSFSAAVDWNGTLVAGRSSEVVSWNGTDWDTVATVNGSVNALAVYQGGLLALGSFTTIGGVAATRVAWFDGASWHPLGAGLPSSNPGSVVTLGSDIYVSLATLYHWDGAAWSTSPGSLLNGQVNGATTDGTSLYVAGSFTKAGTDSCPGVARWDGSQWHRVGVGTPPSVSAITWWNGSLVAGIRDGADLLSRFDGTYWSGLGDASFGAAASGITRLGVWGTRLVAREDYRPAGGAVADIRSYDGVSWTNVVEAWGPDMTGTNGYIWSARVVNDLLYVTGANRYAANSTQVISTNNVGAWDGTAWSGVGTGVPGQPFHVGEFGGQPVVAGSFTLPSGGGAGIAQWNGTAWTGFGNDLPSNLGTAEHLGSLYACYGTFGSGGVARWTGSAWVPVAASSGLNNQCNTLLSWTSGLVVGGEFTLADGQPRSHIASWDGSQWQPLGTGLDGSCTALASFAGDLVAGGSFTHAGGEPAVGAARWDGSSWHAMGTRAVFVTSYTTLAGTLYGAGIFLQPDGSPSQTVARWTGTEWQTLGSGVQVPTSAPLFGSTTNLSLWWVAGYHGDLYAGGTMSYAFGKTTSCIVRLPAANTVGVDDGPRPTAVTLAVSPNPSRGLAVFSFALPEAGHARLGVYDISGREVARLLDGPVLPGRHELRWTAPAPAGVYFARLEAPGGVSRLTRVVRFE